MIISSTFVVKKVIFILTPLILIVVVYSASAFLSTRFLSEEYDKEIWTTSHGTWHPLVIGLTIDPVLYEEYVCSEQPIKDQLKNFRTLFCNETLKRFTMPRLYYGVFGQPSDMHGFHAAVKSLREQGSDQQIGSKVENPYYFNLNWKEYDETLKSVFFQILLNNPIDVMYVCLIAKPLKYAKEAVFYSKYFIISIIGSNIKSIFLLFIIYLIFSYYFSLRMFKGYINNKNDLKNKKLYLRYFLMMYFSSLIPSIIFYSQAHTISDSITVILALLLLLPFIFIQRRTELDNKLE